MLLLLLNEPTYVPITAGNEEDFQGAVGGKAPTPGGLVQVLNSSGTKRDKSAAEEGLYKKDKGGKQSKYYERRDGAAGTSAGKHFSGSKKSKRQ